MAVVFEKYTEKSFVVRGTLFDDSVKRKEVSKQFQGNCIWNTRLKGGPGLLVPINDNNQSVLDKLSNDQKKSEDDKPKKEMKQLEDSDTEESPRKSSNNRSKHDSDSESNSDSESSRRVDSRSSRDSRDSRDSRERRSSSSRDSDESSDEDDSRRRSSRDRERSSGKRDYHRSRSPVSSDSEDSSEDERIQCSIRKRGKCSDDEEKEELDTTIDSDVEDVVSLSRRLRYFERRIQALEKKQQHK